jgi:hypothetical protein
MDDVRGWEAGRLQRGGREEGRGFLEVSSRLSIVERLPVGATARAGTGEQRSVVASEPTSRQGQASAGDRCHDAKLPAGWRSTPRILRTPGSRYGCTRIAVGRGQPATRAPDSAQSAAQQRGWRLAVGGWQLQDQEHSAGSPGLIIQLHVQSRCKGAHSRTVRRSASPVQLYI